MKLNRFPLETNFSVRRFRYSRGVRLLRAGVRRNRLYSSYERPPRNAALLSKTLLIGAPTETRKSPKALLLCKPAFRPSRIGERVAVFGASVSLYDSARRVPIRQHRTPIFLAILIVLISRRVFFAPSGICSQRNSHPSTGRRCG